MPAPLRLPARLAVTVLVATASGCTPSPAPSPDVITTAEAGADVATTAEAGMDVATTAEAGSDVVAPPEAGADVAALTDAADVADVADACPVTTQHVTECQVCTEGGDAGFACANVACNEDCPLECGLSESVCTGDAPTTDPCFAVNLRDDDGGDHWIADC